MRAIEKIRSFFKREKATTKVEPKSTTTVIEKKTIEASGQEEIKG